MLEEVRWRRHFFENMPKNKLSVISAGTTPKSQLNPIVSLDNG